MVCQSYQALVYVMRHHLEKLLAHNEESTLLHALYKIGILKKTATEYPALFYEVEFQISEAYEDLPEDMRREVRSQYGYMFS